VSDIDELVALATSDRRPWVSGPKEYFVRIKGERITGRRLNLDQPDL
jgi:hypothetical protein